MHAVLVRNREVLWRGGKIIGVALETQRGVVEIIGVVEEVQRRVGSRVSLGLDFLNLID